MRSGLSHIEYYLLALLQGFVVILIAFAWVAYQVFLLSAYWAFEVLLACLRGLDRHGYGLCRSTIALLQWLPPEFGTKIYEEENDAD